MKTAPFPLRLDEDIHEALAEGTRRTPFPKQELVRLTLRRYLSKVIKEETLRPRKARLTSILPWPNGKLAAAYRRVDKDWNAVEELAMRAQETPHFND